jgi:hypothetical protein
MWMLMHYPLNQTAHFQSQLSISGGVAMSRILSYIDGYKDGDSWEKLCVDCYRIRYQEDHYQEVPAVHGGDAGIEGFTKSGVVHQCYCPEKDYSDSDLYNHLRDKMTADIDKLLNNGKRLTDLGVPPITEWHFNIPEYRDSRILTHAAAKQKEVIDTKAANSTEYTHIADGFQIVIKVAEDFAPEISRIVRGSLTGMKLNLAIEHTDNWEECDSEKVENIRRKVKAVMHVDDDSDKDLNEVVGIYIGCYISGIEIMNRLRVSFPEIYGNVFELEKSFKQDVSLKTRMNTDHTMNHAVFNDILNDFQSKLEREFATTFTVASIGELKQDMVASWLADCSMEFRSL